MQLWDHFRGNMMQASKIMSAYAVQLHQAYDDCRHMLSGDDQDQVIGESRSAAHLSGGVRMAYHFLHVAYAQRIFADKHILDLTFKHGADPLRVAEDMRDKMPVFHPFAFRESIGALTGVAPMLYSQIIDTRTPLQETQLVNLAVAHDLIDVCYERGKPDTLKTIEALAGYNAAYMLHDAIGRYDGQPAGQSFEAERKIPKRYFTYHDFQAARQALSLNLEGDAIARHVTDWAEKQYNPSLTAPFSHN